METEGEWKYSNGQTIENDGVNSWIAKIDNCNCPGGEDKQYDEEEDCFYSDNWGYPYDEHCSDQRYFICEFLNWNIENCVFLRK